MYVGMPVKQSDFGKIVVVNILMEEFLHWGGGLVDGTKTGTLESEHHFRSMFWR